MNLQFNYKPFQEKVNSFARFLPSFANFSPSYNRGYGTHSEKHRHHSERDRQSLDNSGRSPTFSRERIALKGVADGVIKRASRHQRNDRGNKKNSCGGAENAGHDLSIERTCRRRDKARRKSVAPDKIGKQICTPTDKPRHRCGEKP